MEQRVGGRTGRPLGSPRKRSLRTADRRFAALLMLPAALFLAVFIGWPLLQFVADAQMRAFIRIREPGQAMDRGLWAWSRHPNYFGEISFWFALTLLGIARSPDDWWWWVIGTVAMVAMFQGASIPMMEERSLDRRPAYADVIARVPRLVPRPPRRTAG